MRKVYTLLALLLGCWAVAAQTTNISLLSLSVQIDPATARAPLSDLEWNSSISSFPRTADPNGEMELADADISFTHQGYFVWADPILFETTVFPFALDVPEQGDKNSNGIGDFFDPEVGTANLRTAGLYRTPEGDGADFTATWTRSAGQTAGTVVLDFPDLGLRFTHDYRLLNYNGSFDFRRLGFADFSGMIALTNVLTTNDVIRGPLSLTLTNNDTFGYVPGEWIQTGDITNKFAPIDALDRIGTNFLSLLALGDGFPTTPEPDYLYWLLLIRSSDTNANNIADIVESPHGDPLLPTLSIAREPAGVQISIQGPAGASFVLEEAGDMPSAIWQPLQTITLPPDTQQTIQRPATASRKFYRLRRT